MDYIFCVRAQPFHIAHEKALLIFFQHTVAPQCAENARDGDLVQVEKFGDIVVVIARQIAASRFIHFQALEHPVTQRSWRRHFGLAEVECHQITALVHSCSHELL